MLVYYRGAQMLTDAAPEHHVINPLDGSAPEWTARLICVDNEHFALLVKVADTAEGSTRRPPELDDRLMRQAKIDSQVLAAGEKFAASQGTTQRELLRRYSEAMDDQRVTRLQEEEEPLTFARQLEAAIQDSMDTAEEYRARQGQAGAAQKDQLEVAIENSLLTAATEEGNWQRTALPASESDLHLAEEELYDQPEARRRSVQWVEPLVSSVRHVVVAESYRSGGLADQEADALPPRHAASHTFKTEAEMDLYLASPASEALRHLVAYEFSGALRSSLAKQLEPKGELVMSVDRRATERPGLHFEGDVWTLVSKKQWACIWFVGPPCFQHLRFDDYLGHKIEDGRAYWAGREVVKCICCPFADSVFVEQPDTIGHDYIDVSMLEGTYVMTVRTSQFGDDTDKFMRFTLRNLSIAEPPLPQAPARKKDEKRSQFLFANADERDRKRSSWAQHPRMCDHIATTATFEVPPWPAPDFQAAKQRFAEAWKRAGHPVPADGLNPEGLPSTDEGRAYQMVRGAGHLGSKAKIKMLRGGRGAQGIKNGQVEELDADTAAVVPVAFVDGEPVAYVPSDPAQIGIVEEPASGEGRSLMAKAESAVRSIACAAGSLFAYRAGVTADHAKLVVVAAEKPASEAPIVKDPKEREHRRGAGVLVLWCTLAALGTSSAVTTADAIARLAIVSTSQFRAYEPHVAEGFRAEAALREATGMRPGRSSMMGPLRNALEADGTVTPRQLIPRAQQGLVDLRMALTEGTGPFAAYLAKWADSQLPLQLAEVPADLLDAGLHLADARLKEELFAPRLPIYELPWLPRQPPQAFDDRPGCEDFTPHRVADLSIATQGRTSDAGGPSCRRTSSASKG